MHTYLRLLAYIKPYRFKLLLSFVFTLAFSLSHSLVSAVSYIIANGFYNTGYVVLDNLPSLSFLQNITFSASYIPWIVFFVFLTRGIFDYLSNYLIAGV